MQIVSLERKLLGGYPLFVPAFDADVARYLSGNSAFTRGMDISLFIASDGENETFSSEWEWHPATREEFLEYFSIKFYRIRFTTGYL